MTLWRAGALGGILLTLLLALFLQEAKAEPPGYQVGVRHLTLVDESRSIKASMGFEGSPTRRLDTTVWYPAKSKQGATAEDAPLAKGGPWPLLIYSHGTFAHADNIMHLVNDLVAHGYVVAAPDYPLTSRAAFTRIQGPDVSDVVNQTADIGFIIDSLLADRTFGPVIDKTRIGTTGHSLGAVTSYFASFAAETRDPRVAATALLGAGDPVQAALSTDMGLAGAHLAPVSVPVLFLTAERDVFALLTGRPHGAYSRLEPPKYEAVVKDGVHVWFTDSDAQPADGKNPDCLFFERMAPDMKVRGCDGGAELIGPARQQEITRIAVRAFFDAYLKQDAGALERLRELGTGPGDVELVYEEQD